MKVFAALAAVTALAGCASLNDVYTDVSTFSRWPAGRAPTTYAFERLPSQQAQPQQAQMLEDAARLAIERAGFVPASEGSVADVTMQLGARITETFGYAGYARAYWRRGYWGPGAWGTLGPYAWGPYYTDFPNYQREVALLIRDKRSGEPLYETRATSEGLSAGIERVLPAMFTASLKDFPVGNATNPQRVTIRPAPAP